LRRGWGATECDGASAGGLSRNVEQVFDGYRQASQRRFTDVRGARNGAGLVKRRLEKHMVAARRLRRINGLLNFCLRVGLAAAQQVPRRVKVWEHEVTGGSGILFGFTG